MSTIPLELPQDLQSFIEAKVQQGEFASVNDYLIALVSTARSKLSEIEAALVEGLESGPAEEWTSQEWCDLKQRVRNRHQAGS